MADFHQNTESKRFLRVLDELISKQKVKNDSDFCKSMGYSAQSFSQIRKGKRDVTVELLSKLFSKYAGNPIFIFSGEGSLIAGSHVSMVAEPDVAPMINATIVELRDKNARLEKMLDFYTKQSELTINYTNLLQEEKRKLEEQIKQLTIRVKK